MVGNPCTRCRCCMCLSAGIDMAKRGQCRSTSITGPNRTVEGHYRNTPRTIVETDAKGIRSAYHREIAEEAKLEDQEPSLDATDQAAMLVRAAICPHKTGCTTQSRTRMSE